MASQPTDSGRGPAASSQESPPAVPPQPQATGASGQPVDGQDVELGLPAEEQPKPDGNAEEQPPLQDRITTKLVEVKEEIQARDPVQKGRCTLGSAGFAGVGLLGLVFFGIGCAEEDVWEILSSIFMVALGGYSVVYLGGDPCLLNAFREQVNGFHKQNKRFKTSNDHLEGKLANLQEVSDNLEEVRQQMGSDLATASKLLNNMERFSALQTVSAVINQFYAADYDNSGHINGDEALFFVPQLSSVWALQPDFDPERLLNHVRENGLTLTQLSVLLDCLVADDKDKCLEELEKLVAQPPPPGKLEVSGREVRAEDDAAQAPAHLEELYEEVAMQNAGQNAMQTIRNVRMPQWMSNLSAENRRAKDDNALKPWFEIGPLQVWSILHLSLMLATVGGIVFTVASFVVFEVTNIVGSLIGIALASGLTAASRLIEVLRALRLEVVALRIENDRLEALRAELSDKVTRLGKLHRGYQVLQAECGGNVAKAHDLIEKSNTNTRMSAMAVVTRIFRDADVNHNHTIDKDEVDSFVQRLELAFGSVGGFTAQKARIVADGLTSKELKQLVDMIVRVEDGPA